MKKYFANWDGQNFKSFTTLEECVKESKGIIKAYDEKHNYSEEAESEPEIFEFDIERGKVTRTFDLEGNLVDDFTVLD